MNGTLTTTNYTSTSTPPPLNGAGAEGNELTNGVSVLKFSTGLILPPPDVKCTSLVVDFQFLIASPEYARRIATINRTIVHMNRSSDPLQFEVKLRESRRTDPAFSFLNPADPYHAYYRHRLEQAMRGEVLDGLPADVDGKVGETEEGTVSEDYGKPPPPSEFILEVPNVSAVDLCVLDYAFPFTG